MRALGRSLAVASLSFALAGPALAQTAPAKTFMSAADLKALAAQAKKDLKPGETVITVPVLRMGPYRPNLDYRNGVSSAAIHEDEGEFFYVLEGTGTLRTGGKLVNEVRTGRANLSGTAIEGGEDRRVGKGDFFMVPEKTAHWFSTVDGEFEVLSLHVPRPPAAP
jgi:mannose-6-phosphate isomerase-like protein (cupin superfamily)